MWNGRSSCASSGPVSLCGEPLSSFPRHSAQKPSSSPASPSISLSRVMRSVPQRDGGNASNTVRMPASTVTPASSSGRFAQSAIAAARASSPCPRASAMESNGRQLSAARSRSCGGISGSRLSRHLAAQFWAMSRATAKARGGLVSSSRSICTSAGRRCMLMTTARCSSGSGNVPIAAMASGANVENLWVQPPTNRLILPPRLAGLMPDEKAPVRGPSC